MRKPLIKSVKYNIVFILVLFNFVFLQLYPKPFTQIETSKYSYSTGNFHFALGLDLNYMNKDSVIVLLVIYGDKVKKAISLNLSGKVVINPSYKVLTDECSKTEYPVNCYSVENDTCSFDIYISIWKDRVFIIDKKNYLKNKYPQYEINLSKTLRLRIVPDSSD